jgi:hypothetical protein
LEEAVKAVLRYAVCILVAFLAAAYALSSLLDAYYSLNIHVWFSNSDTQGGITMYHNFYEPSFLWKMLPVALSLTVCVVAWRYRKEPK